jgi:ribosomal protein S21
MEIQVEGNIEAAIRKLRKWFDQNLKKELRTRTGFETRTQKRKRKSIAARRRKKKVERRLMEFKRMGR